MTEPDATTTFSTILAGVLHHEAWASVALPADWLQGRSTFGGMTAALTVAAASALPGISPVLRSAQFAFTAPVSGKVELHREVLRRGRSSTYVGVDVVCDQRLAARALLLFTDSRPSTQHLLPKGMPAVPPPENCPDFFEQPGAPRFTEHFEARLASGSALFSQASEPAFDVWVRHRDTATGPDVPVARLLALADVLPPPVLVLGDGFVPVSTMTWSVDVVLRDEGRDERLDGVGWHLLTSRSDAISDGISSQNMSVWRPEGVRVLTGRQVVTAFF